MSVFRFVLFVVGFLCFAQNKPYDEDSITILETLELAKKKNYNKPQDAIKIYDSILLAIEQGKHKQLVTKIIVYKAEAVINKEEYASALILLKRLVNDKEQESLKGFLLGKAYFLMGKCYFFQGYLENASLAYRKSIAIYEKLGYKEEAIRPINNLALVYNELKQTDKARPYYQKMLRYTANLEDQSHYFRAKINLCYCDGLDAKKANAIALKRNAYRCYIDVLDRLSELNAERFKLVSQAYTAINITDFLDEETYPRIKREMLILKKNVENDRLDVKRHIAAYYFAMAQLRIYENNLSNVEELFRKGDSVLNKHHLLSQERFFENKINYLKKINRYDLAYNAYLSHTKLKDSTNAIYQIKRLTELKDLYQEEQVQSKMFKKQVELENREKELLRNKRKNVGLFFLGTGIIFIFFVIPVIHRNRKKLKKVEKEIESSQKSINKAEAVMHGETQEKLRLAKLLDTQVLNQLNEVSLDLKLVNAVKGKSSETLELNQAIDIIAQSKNKVELLITGLSLSIGDSGVLVKSLSTLLVEYRKLFSGQIVFQYYGEPKDFGTKFNPIIFQIIREPLKNAIKHSQGRLIELFIYFQEKNMKIQINDNGKGFDDNQENYSVGLKNTIANVETLQGSYAIYTSNQGTSFEIDLPYG